MDEWPEKGSKIPCFTLYILFRSDLEYSKPGGCYLLLAPPGSGVSGDVDSVQVRTRVGDHVMGHVGKLVTSLNNV